MKVFVEAWNNIEAKAQELACEATAQGTNCGYTFTGHSLSAEIYESSTGRVLAVVKAA